MTRPGRLGGRTAVVVGVGSVVGRACAALLASEGADVLALDRDLNLAQDACAAIVAAGGAAAPHQADPAGEDDARGVADVCEGRWGGLDILVNCAAAMDFWDDGADSIADWETVIRINLLGPLVYTKALLPLLRRSRQGAVVYLSSIDGIRGNPSFPAYSVSKGALIPLTHVMAYDCAPVRVNCVATAAILQLGPNDPQPKASLWDVLLGPTSALEMTPLGRYATPEDVASVVLFFVSEDAGYVTGTVLPMDGGRLAITPGTARVPPDSA